MDVSWIIDGPDPDQTIIVWTLTCACAMSPLRTKSNNENCFRSSNSYK